MSITHLYGKNDINITGNPKFSFFNNIKNNNKMATHYKLSLENYAHNIKNKSKNYNINLSELLHNTYDLLGGIFINILNCGENIDFDISFAVDEVIFHYDMDKIKVLSSLLNKNFIFYNESNIAINLLDSLKRYILL